MVVVDGLQIRNGGEQARPSGRRGARSPSSSRLPGASGAYASARSRLGASGCVRCRAKEREVAVRDAFTALYDHSVRHWVESLLRLVGPRIDRWSAEAVRCLLAARQREVDRYQQTNQTSTDDLRAFARVV